MSIFNFNKTNSPTAVQARKITKKNSGIMPTLRLIQERAELGCICLYLEEGRLLTDEQVEQLEELGYEVSIQTKIIQRIFW